MRGHGGAGVDDFADEEGVDGLLEGRELLVGFWAAGADAGDDAEEEGVLGGWSGGFGGEGCDEGRDGVG